VNLKNILIILSHKCNYRCEHCYDKKNRNLLDDYTIFQNTKIVIKKLKDLGVDSVKFTGGECTLFKHFPDLLDFTHRNNIKMSIFTNGSNKDFSLYRHVSAICTSLDGNETKHNMIRGENNAYKNVLKLIKRFYNSEKIISIQSTISKNNIDDLSFLDSVSNLINRDKDKVFVSSMVRTGDYLSDKLLLSSKDNKAVYYKINELLARNNYHLDISTNVIRRQSLEYIKKETFFDNMPVFLDIATDEYYIFSDKIKFSDVCNINFSLLKKVCSDMKNNFKKLQSLKYNEFINIEDEIIRIIPLNKTSSSLPLWR
jgi:MoaA/NifB/PqqE/SkfB family radical SAM enzyme